MTGSLCASCRSIPPGVFSADDNSVVATLSPLNWMLRTAKAGCPLCAVLTADLDVDNWSSEISKGQSTTLKRSMLNTHRAVDLVIGNLRVSQSYFFRAPSRWSHYDPAALIVPERHFNLMKQWVHECTQSHPHCTTHQVYFVPTRLLDLRAFERSKNVKLVNLNPNDLGAQYVALSHCWGPPSKRPLTTTKETLETRMECITYDSLSKTFQDAVDVCRSLGLRYLWIDSLCILQDDPNDWKKEAATMPKVYGGSILTLAALSSKDGTEGCRVKGQSENRISPYADLDNGDLRVRILAWEPSYWDEEYGDGLYYSKKFDHNPLRSRAWALQERQLSTRNICFSENMLLWECRTTKGSSELPWEHMIPSDEFEQLPLRKFPDEDLFSEGSLALRERWYSIVEDYTSRFLTEESDRLPALAGLASRYFHDHYPTAHYLSGLWLSELPFAFLWKTQTHPKIGQHSASQPRRPSTYRAPTWSWASIEGSVTYASQRVENFFGDRTNEAAADFDQHRFKILESLGEPADPSQLDSVARKSLTVRGLVQRVHVRRQRPTARQSYHKENLRVLLNDEGTVVGGLYPDVDSELLSVGHVHCLCLRTEPHWGNWRVPAMIYDMTLASCEDFSGENATVMGLALVRDRSERKSYRRVGLVRWMRRHAFKECEPRKITLI